MPWATSDVHGADVVDAAQLQPADRPEQCRGQLSRARVQVTQTQPVKQAELIVATEVTNAALSSAIREAVQASAGQ